MESKGKLIFCAIIHYTVVCSQELDFMILMGSFQLGVLYDSMIEKQRPVCTIRKNSFDLSQEIGHQENLGMNLPSSKVQRDVWIHLCCKGGWARDSQKPALPLRCAILFHFPQSTSLPFNQTMKSPHQYKLLPCALHSVVLLRCLIKKMEQYRRSWLQIRAFSV